MVVVIASCRIISWTIDNGSAAIQSQIGRGMPERMKGNLRPRIILRLDSCFEHISGNNLLQPPVFPGLQIRDEYDTEEKRDLTTDYKLPNGFTKNCQSQSGKDQKYLRKTRVIKSPS